MVRRILTRSNANGLNGRKRLESDLAILKRKRP